MIFYPSQFVSESALLISKALTILSAAVKTTFVIDSDNQQETADAPRRYPIELINTSSSPPSSRYLRNSNYKDRTEKTSF